MKFYVNICEKHGPSPRLANVGASRRGSRFLILKPRFLTRYPRDPSLFLGQLGAVLGSSMAAIVALGWVGSAIVALGWVGSAIVALGWVICGSLGAVRGSRGLAVEHRTSNIEPQLVGFGSRRFEQRARGAARPV